MSPCRNTGERGYAGVWGLYCTVLVLLALHGTAQADTEPRVCQEITIPMCKGIGYNYTYMPNQFNHDTQEEAGLEVSTIIFK